MTKLLTLLFFLSFCITAHALSPEPKLPNEAEEQRAMNLFLQVRCLVCAGQVIENSDTEFSFAMRKLIRQKIAEGKTDQEIKSELVKEFGDNILTEPSAKGMSGFLLWCLPVSFAVVLALFMIKSRR